METRFEMSFQDSEEMYCKLFARLYGKRYMVYAIFFVLFALWMGFLWFLNREWLYGIMMTIFVVGAVWYMHYPAMMGRKNYKSRLQHLRGGEPSIRVAFGDEILVEEDGSGKSLSYERVASFYTNDGLLIFVMQYHSAYFAPLSCLTGGTKEELFAFLKEKCPNAKFHV